VWSSLVQILTNISTYMCLIPSNLKSSLFKYRHTTNLSSTLIAASVVGPGVVWEPLRVLEVATVVVPACGVAPGPPSVIPPLASSVCVSVLVTERQAVVALAPPVVLAVKTLVLVVEPSLVVEPLVLVVEPLVLVVETLVVVEPSLVVEPLVLEVAVEPIVVVVEGLAVVAAAATMLLLTTKETTKEPGSRLILARSLPPPPSIGIAGASLACGQEKPLLTINLLISS